MDNICSDCGLTSSHIASSESFTVNYNKKREIDLGLALIWYFDMLDQQDEELPMALLVLLLLVIINAI